MKKQSIIGYSCTFEGVQTFLKILTKFFKYKLAISNLRLIEIRKNV